MMDITALSFPEYLPGILNELSSCYFVALDLEFSGIFLSPMGQGSKTQSLRERYAETKTAAENYQVLQVGLTICHEDVQNGTYTLKPYNINLTPNTDKRLGITRDWTLMSQCVEFLLSHQFSLDQVCKFGVPYLSRDEEADAIAKAVDSYKSNPPPSKSLDIKEMDHESLEFIQGVRESIDKWLAQGKECVDFLNIPPPIRLQVGDPLPTALNNMQKWLIHQVVRAEYPTLISRSKPRFVQIEQGDPERQRRIQEEKLKQKRVLIQKNIGFRWVAEALVGGDLTGLESGMFAPLMPQLINSTVTMQEFSDGVKERLKANPPVLVGHNMFTDLIYFCRCFLGPLPDTVEEFQAMVHRFFPVVIDTKYLATHDCGSINPASSLENLTQDLSNLPSPHIAIHPRHCKYSLRQICHEAGYDSMLTATAFIKLAAKLKRESKATGKTSVLIPTGPKSMTSKATRYPQGRGDAQKKAQFSNFFDALSGLPGEVPSVGFGGFSAEAAVQAPSGMIPSPSDEFWDVYKNRLRMFGTNERVLTLGEERDEA